MAITYVGGQTLGRTNASAAQAVTFALTGGASATPATGDLVIVTCVTGSAAGNPAMAVATPSGYTALGQLNQTATTADTSLNVSYKRMGAVPDTSVTVPGTTNNAWGEAYCFQVFRGVDPVTPLDVASVSAGGTGTGRPDPGSITPSTTGAYVVLCGGGAITGSGVSYTAPANYTTNFRSSQGTDTTSAMVGMGYRAWTSGAENPAAFAGGTTGAQDSWAAYTLALRPEAPIPFLVLLSGDVPLQVRQPVENISFVTPTATNLLLLYSVTGDLLRNGSVDWPNPAPARAAQQPDLLPNLLVSTLAPSGDAFVQTDWPNPVLSRAAQQPEIPPNLLASTLFEEFEHVPRGALYTRRFHPPYREPFIPPWFDPATTAPVTPSLAQVRAPVFIRRFALPAPAADVFPNLLTSTLAAPAAPAEPPFIPPVLPNPAGRAVLHADLFIDLLGTTLAVVVPPPAPFVPIIFPEPVRHAARPSDLLLVNRLPLIPIRPFVPVLWPDSIRARAAAQPELAVNLLTLDASKGVPFRPLEALLQPLRPAAKAQPPLAVANLTTTTLYVVPPLPKNQADWPNPVIARAVAQPLPPVSLLDTLLKPEVPPPPGGESDDKIHLGTKESIGVTSVPTLGGWHSW